MSKNVRSWGSFNLKRTLDVLGNDWNEKIDLLLHNVSQRCINIRFRKYIIKVPLEGEELVTGTDMGVGTFYPQRKIPKIVVLRQLMLNKMTVERRFARGGRERSWFITYFPLLLSLTYLLPFVVPFLRHNTSLLSGTSLPVIVSFLLYVSVTAPSVLFIKSSILNTSQFFLYWVLCQFLRSNLSLRSHPCGPPDPKTSRPRDFFNCLWSRWRTRRLRKKLHGSTPG